MRTLEVRSSAEALSLYVDGEARGDVGAGFQAVEAYAICFVEERVGGAARML